MKHRIFSIRPALVLRGRTFKGLRGWAGKPLHPPLTDIPVTAYILAALFDLGSYVVSPELYTAATWSLVVGAVVSVGTALTGFWDWWRSTPKHTQAWRTANWHMAVMLTVTLLVVVDLFLRIAAYDATQSGAAPVPVTVLTVVIAGLVGYGAIYGGALVYDYGFNVETSGDHPAWHESETDVSPTDPAPPTG